MRDIPISPKKGRPVKPVSALPEIMDTLFLDIHIIPSGSFLRIDGIDFKSCAFVVPREGSSLAKIPQLHEAVIVPKELIRSTQGSGKYLIFTDASGIADDGGWTGVEVKFIQNGVHWIFSAGEQDFELVFNNALYCSEIRQIAEGVASLPRGIELEPCQVVFPEDW